MSRRKQIQVRLRGFNDRRFNRRGAVLPLVVVFLVVLLAMAMFTVDVAYMQLVRTEMRAATDAAAKAGVEALGRNQSSEAAIAAAIDLASRNQVAGSPVILRAEDITIGTSAYQSDGSWQFSPGGTRPNAVRVNTAFNNTSPNGSVPLFLAGMFGNGYFSPEQQATAAGLELDICLAVDRSHSMCFDLSGVDWSYPSGTPRYPDPVAYPPNSTHSRWASLDSAVDLFLDTAADTFKPPRVALVTWGSRIDRSTYEYYITRQTAPAVSNDVGLTNSYNTIKQSIQSRGNNVMLGGTNLSAGLDAAVALLEADQTRPYSRKYVILMTDGQWNEGRDPVLAAQDAARANIVVHTVTFLSRADQSTMAEVAELTGGQHYHADDRDELEQAFVELARTLPVVLTQ